MGTPIINYRSLSLDNSNTNFCTIQDPSTLFFASQTHLPRAIWTLRILNLAINFQSLCVKPDFLGGSLVRNSFVVIMHSSVVNSLLVNISFDNVDKSKTNWAKIHFWLATVDLRK